MLTNYIATHPVYTGMDEFDPAPAVDDAAEPRQQWLDETDTFGRVYDVVLGITSPTPAAEIAEIADCSPNAATKHLTRLAEMGVVEARARRDGHGAAVLHAQTAVEGFYQALGYETVSDVFHEAAIPHVEMRKRL